MSDYLPPMHETLRGDWWNIASAFEQLAECLAPGLTPRPSGAFVGGVYQVLVFGGPNAGGTLGEITFAGADGRTQITIEAARPASVDYWSKAIDQLRRFAETARQLRREAAPTNDDAIERYYRSRAAGSRVTLRQIAEDANLSYEAVKKRKQRYDERGGWGSKKGQQRSREIQRIIDPDAT